MSLKFKTHTDAVATPLTCLTVVHPIEDDFWSSVPPGGHITGHGILGVSGQAKVQDLQGAEYQYMYMEYNNHKLYQTQDSGSRWILHYYN